MICPRPMRTECLCVKSCQTLWGKPATPVVQILLVSPSRCFEARNSASQLLHPRHVTIIQEKGSRNGYPCVVRSYQSGRIHKHLLSPSYRVPVSPLMWDMELRLQKERLIADGLSTGQPVEWSGSILGFFSNSSAIQS